MSFNQIKKVASIADPYKRDKLLSMQKFTRYHDAVSFLEGLANIPSPDNYMSSRKNLSMYLKRMRYFLTLLGNPDKDMKFIHITGTAGKGSVTNMLHETLLASGKKVGSFTSPFVTTSIEKIKVNDLYISPDEFADLVDIIKPALDKAYLESPYGRPSYFDIFVAIGLLYFKQKQCEWVVLEVGCGGRYDSTNVIENPVITAITNIDYDHMEIFGNTLQDVAYEKAGIIKKGSHFFTAEQRKPLTKFFEKTCQDVGASFHQIPLQNTYSQSNEALVREIAYILNINDKHINMGISRSHLQCRFEIMQKNPLVIIDGAHNKIKVESTVNNLTKLTYKKLFLVLAISNNKEHLSILNQIVPLSDHTYFTRFQIKERKCAHPKDLLIKSRKFMKKGSRSHVYLDCNQALEHALKSATRDDAILVVGSFFLAGELRKKWYPEEYILKKRKSL